VQEHTCEWGGWGLNTIVKQSRDNRACFKKKGISFRTGVIITSLDLHQHLLSPLDQHYLTSLLMPSFPFTALFINTRWLMSWYSWCIICEEIVDLLLFGFLREQKWGLNTYLYAPKDDYKHRMYWRDLYSAEESGEFQPFACRCYSLIISRYSAISSSFGKVRVAWDYQITKNTQDRTAASEDN